MKRLLFLVPVVAFVALIGVFAHGLTQDPSRIPSVMIDRPLPPFRLAGLDAASGGFASTDLGVAGTPSEPRLLNVFASWCASCPQEHPMLFTIAASGVPVYGIDWKDAPDAGRKWLAALGNPYHRIGSDPTARTGIDLGVTGVPETFVVDRRGRIRYKQVGTDNPGGLARHAAADARPVARRGMRAALAVVALLFATPTLAVLPSEQLGNPVLEARARAISAQIRCVVCQNQSIDDSDAPLAHDLRMIVRERLVAGDSDAQAMQFLVNRYGHYVLMKPPFESATLALWLAPAGLLITGAVGVAVMLRRKHGAATAALSTAEDEEATRLLTGTTAE